MKKKNMKQEKKKNQAAIASAEHKQAMNDHDLPLSLLAIEGLGLFWPNQFGS
jgi:hypothetical protein